MLRYVYTIKVMHITQDIIYSLCMFSNSHQSMPKLEENHTRKNFSLSKDMHPLILVTQALILSSSFHLSLQLCCHSWIHRSIGCCFVEDKNNDDDDDDNFFWGTPSCRCSVSIHTCPYSSVNVSQLFIGFSSFKVISFLEGWNQVRPLWIT